MSYRIGGTSYCCPVSVRLTCHRSRESLSILCALVCWRARGFMGRLGIPFLPFQRRIGVSPELLTMDSDEAIVCAPERVPPFLVRSEEHWLVGSAFSRMTKPEWAQLITTVMYVHRHQRDYSSTRSSEWMGKRQNRALGQSAKTQVHWR